MATGFWKSIILLCTFSRSAASVSENGTLETDISNDSVGASNGSVSNLAGSLPERCLLPKDPGFQPAAIGVVRRWYFDTARSRCTEFVFVPQGGNANNFHTKDECESICKPSSDGSQFSVDEANTDQQPRQRICGTRRRFERPTHGLCVSGGQALTSPQSRWYFSAEKQDCVAFSYYGCGDDDAFKTKTSCDVRCKMQDGPSCAGGSMPYTGENGKHAQGKNCSDLKCPSGYRCIMGWLFASCCNETIDDIYEAAYSEKCPNGVNAYSIPAADHTLAFFAESCDYLTCPDGFECVQINDFFAKCCAVSTASATTTPASTSGNDNGIGGQSNAVVVDQSIDAVTGKSAVAPCPEVGSRQAPKTVQKCESKANDCIAGSLCWPSVDQKAFPGSYCCPVPIETKTVPTGVAHLLAKQNCSAEQTAAIRLCQRQINSEPIIDADTVFKQKAPINNSSSSRSPFDKPEAHCQTYDDYRACIRTSFNDSEQPTCFDYADHVTRNLLGKFCESRMRKMLAGNSDCLSALSKSPEFRHCVQQLNRTVDLLKFVSQRQSNDSVDYTSLCVASHQFSTCVQAIVSVECGSRVSDIVREFFNQSMFTIFGASTCSQLTNIGVANSTLDKIDIPSSAVNGAFSDGHTSHVVSTTAAAFSSDELPKSCKNAAADVNRNGPGGHVAQCDSNGNYELVQCNAEKSECWCVNIRNGEEIAGSRTVGDKPGNAPSPLCPNNSSSFLAPSNFSINVLLTNTSFPYQEQCTGDVLAHFLLCQKNLDVILNSFANSSCAWMPLFRLQKSDVPAGETWQNACSKYAQVVISRECIETEKCQSNKLQRVHRFLSVVCRDDIIELMRERNSVCMDALRSSAETQKCPAVQWPCVDDEKSAASCRESVMRHMRCLEPPVRRVCGDQFWRVAIDLIQHFFNFSSPATVENSTFAFSASDDEQSTPAGPTDLEEETTTENVQRPPQNSSVDFVACAQPIMRRWKFLALLRNMDDLNGNLCSDLEVYRACENTLQNGTGFDDFKNSSLTYRTVDAVVAIFDSICQQNSSWSQNRLGCISTAVSSSNISSCLSEFLQSPLSLDFALWENSTSADQETFCGDVAELLSCSKSSIIDSCGMEDFEMLIDSHDVFLSSLRNSACRLNRFSVKGVCVQWQFDRLLRCDRDLLDSLVDTTKSWPSFSPGDVKINDLINACNSLARRRECGRRIDSCVTFIGSLSAKIYEDVCTKNLSAPTLSLQCASRLRSDPNARDCLTILPEEAFSSHGIFLQNYTDSAGLTCDTLQRFTGCAKNVVDQVCGPEASSFLTQHYLQFLHDENTTSCQGYSTPSENSTAVSADCPLEEVELQKVCGANLVQRLDLLTQNGTSFMMDLNVPATCDAYIEYISCKKNFNSSCRSTPTVDAAERTLEAVFGYLCNEDGRATFDRLETCLVDIFNESEISGCIDDFDAIKNQDDLDALFGTHRLCRRVQNFLNCSRYTLERKCGRSAYEFVDTIYLRFLSAVEPECPFLRSPANNGTVLTEFSFSEENGLTENENSKQDYGESCAVFRPFSAFFSSNFTFENVDEFCGSLKVALDLAITDDVSCAPKLIGAFQNLHEYVCRTNEPNFVDNFACLKNMTPCANSTDGSLFACEKGQDLLNCVTFQIAETCPKSDIFKISDFIFRAFSIFYTTTETTCVLISNQCPPEDQSRAMYCAANVTLHWEPLLFVSNPSQFSRFCDGYAFYEKCNGLANSNAHVDCAPKLTRAAAAMARYFCTEFPSNSTCLPKLLDSQFMQDCLNIFQVTLGVSDSAICDSTAGLLQCVRGPFADACGRDMYAQVLGAHNKFLETVDSECVFLLQESTEQPKCTALEADSVKNCDADLMDFLLERRLELEAIFKPSGINMDSNSILKTCDRMDSHSRCVSPFTCRTSTTSAFLAIYENNCAHPNSFLQRLNQCFLAKIQDATVASECSPFIPEDAFSVQEILNGTVSTAPLLSMACANLSPFFECAFTKSTSVCPDEVAAHLVDIFLNIGNETWNITCEKARNDSRHFDLQSPEISNNNSSLILLDPYFWNIFNGTCLVDLLQNESKFPNSTACSAWMTAMIAKIDFRAFICEHYKYFFDCADALGLEMCGVASWIEVKNRANNLANAWTHKCGSKIDSSDVSSFTSLEICLNDVVNNSKVVHSCSQLLPGAVAVVPSPNFETSFATFFCQNLNFFDCKASVLPETCQNDTWAGVKSRLLRTAHEKNIDCVATVTTPFFESTNFTETSNFNTTELSTISTASDTVNFAILDKCLDDIIQNDTVLSYCNTLLPDSLFARPRFSNNLANGFVAYLAFFCGHRQFFACASGYAPEICGADVWSALQIQASRLVANLKIDCSKNVSYLETTTSASFSSEVPLTGQEQFALRNDNWTATETVLEVTVPRETSTAHASRETTTEAILLEITNVKANAGTYLNGAAAETTQQTTTASGAIEFTLREDDLVLGFSKPETVCEKRRFEALLAQANSTSWPPQYVPLCKDDGQFESLQCDLTSGYCWCVDPVTGDMINDTRAGPSQKLPTCGVKKLFTCSKVPSKPACVPRGEKSQAVLRYYFNGADCTPYKYSYCQTEAHVPPFPFKTAKDCEAYCRPPRADEVAK